MNVDTAKEHFEAYKLNINQYSDINLTESDTRSKILDELLVKILGWQETDIRREGHTVKGYYDYLINVPNFKFIIEAKKGFVEFTLPQRNRTVSIQSIYRENTDVINQIRNYLIEVGLQFGIITNGRQFIIGRFINNDGTPWLQNKCLIFNSIEDVENRFVEFYNCISKLNVINNLGFDFLKEEIIKPRIIISNIAGKDNELIRNSLSSQMTPIINELFGEINKHDELDDKTLIEYCFVENEEIKKNRSDIERLFADKPPSLGEVIPIVNTRNISNHIKKEIELDNISIKNTTPPKPIIIVGSKGAGKTTFINYLFKLSFDNEFLKKRPYVHVDFRTYTENDFNNIDERVIKDALDFIYDKYSELELYSLKVLKRIYIQDIQRYDKGTWAYNKENNDVEYNNTLNKFLDECQKDNQNHFIKLSEYLIRERQMRLCIIIDNADQFGTEVQRKAFLFAQSINIKAKCAVILSLREGYYYTWRNKPPFDAFASNVYHVTAPPYREVLQKRIEFSLASLNLEGKTLGTTGAIRVELRNDRIKSFFLSLNRSLFGFENSGMLDFLQETTYPNIRAGLEIFRHFLLSGHTNVEQYVLRQQGGEIPVNPIPTWEFVKAVALENKMYYNHNFSRISNIFYPASDSNSHFLKYKLLSYLKQQLGKFGYREKYVQVKQLFDDFSLVNYTPKAVISELNELLSNALIETDKNSFDIDTSFVLSDDDNISISMKGNYYITSLVPTFGYFDLVVQDTPIYLEEFYNKIRHEFPLSEPNGKRNIVGRCNTISNFVGYLLEMEKRETIENEIIPFNIMKEIISKGLASEMLNVTMSQNMSLPEAILNNL